MRVVGIFNYIALVAGFEADMKVTFHFDVLVIDTISEEDPVSDSANG